MEAEAFSWKGRKVFLTGASGFVGTGLLARLSQQGAMVTALIPPKSIRFPVQESGNIRVVEAFIEDADSIRDLLLKADADTVFHLAAINVNVGTSVSPLSIFETNIRGTWNVLEASRNAPHVERVVLASSREAEWETCDPGKRDQLRLNRRHHPYQVSKMSAELIAHAYCDTFDMPIAISRSDNIYGGGDFNWARLIPSACKAILEGKAPVLRSDGTLARDYVYIEDMIIAYMTLAAKSGEPGIKGAVFHFATGIGITALDIVSTLCELAGLADLQSVVLNESKEERINQPRDTSRELKLLGWSSSVQIEDGLRLTLDWYRDYFKKIAR